MILDAQNQFSNAQALTASAAPTNVIDLGIARNLFDGEPMAVVVIVDVAAATNDGDETYQFDLQTDGDEAFGSATTILSHAIGRASLTAASKHVIPVPVGVELERYFRLYYTLGGTTPTITVTSFLMPLSMVQKDKSYADNITIS